MTARRYPTERLHDPGSDRAQCSAPLPPPPVVGGGDDNDVDWVARGLSSSGGGSIVALTLHRSSASLSLWGGEGGGGGEEACGIPGRGEENEYRGRKVQGGVEVDEAPHGGRKRMVAASAAGPPVPGAGDELGCGGRRRWPGTGRPLCGCPPVTFQRGVSPPATCQCTRRRRWLDGAWGLRSSRIGVK
jgi:hypothetical protein